MEGGEDLFSVIRFWYYNGGCRCGYDIGVGDMEVHVVDRGGWMGCGMWESHTRLLCWTASGTRGVISRESSCFVGAILAALMSFYSRCWV